MLKELLIKFLFLTFIVSFHLFATEKVYLPNTERPNVVEEINNTMWVGTDDGIVILDTNNKIIEHLYDFPQIDDPYPSITGIYVDLNGIIFTLVNTEFNSKKVTLLYKKNNDNWERIDEQNGSILSVSSVFISSLGEFWGIRDDLSVFKYEDDLIKSFDIATKDVKFIRENAEGQIIFIGDSTILKDDEIFNISSNEIKNVYVDKNNNLVLLRKTKTGGSFNPPEYTVMTYNWNDSGSCDAEYYEFGLVVGNPGIDIYKDQYGREILDYGNSFFIIEDSVVMDTIEQNSEFNKLLKVIDENTYLFSDNSSLIKVQGEKREEIDCRVLNTFSNASELIINDYDKFIVGGNYKSRKQHNLITNDSLINFDELFGFQSNQYSLKYADNDSSNATVFMVWNNRLDTINPDIGIIKFDGINIFKNNVSDSCFFVPSTYGKDNVLWGYISDTAKDIAFIVSKKGSELKYLSNKNCEDIPVINCSRIEIMNDSLMVMETSFDQGVSYIYNLNSNKVSKILNIYENFGFIIDKNENLWSIQYDNYKWSYYVTNSENETERFYTPGIKGLKKYKSNIIVGYGLKSLYVWENSDFKIVYVNDGITNESNFIVDIDFDKEGNVWCLFENGCIASMPLDLSTSLKCNKKQVQNSLNVQYFLKFGILKFSYFPNQKGVVIVRMLNLKGQVIKECVYDTLPRESISSEIDMSQFAHGTYLFQFVENNKVVYVSKVIFNN